MKSICRIVWLLGAMLVVGTLDKVPDPQASSPSKCLHEHSVAVIVTPTPRAGVPPHLPVTSISFDAVESLLYIDRNVLIEYASDPSPPAPGPCV